MKFSHTGIITARLSIDQLREIVNKDILKSHLIYKEKVIEGLYCYRDANGFQYVANSDISNKYPIIYTDHLSHDNGDIEIIILFIDDKEPEPSYGGKHVYAGMYRLEGSVASGSKEELYGVDGSFYSNPPQIVWIIFMVY